MPAGGLPGLRSGNRPGTTVPDLDAAPRFFVDVLGAEGCYVLGPIEAEDDWVETHPGVATLTASRPPLLTSSRMASRSCVSRRCARQARRRSDPDLPLAPWELRPELVGYPGGKGCERHTPRRLWDPRNPNT